MVCETPTGPHGREENSSDIVDESCVRKSIEEPISCCAQNRRRVCGPRQSTEYSSEQGSAVAKTARRLENEEVIDKFRNLRELLGFRRRFSHVTSRTSSSAGSVTPLLRAHGEVRRKCWHHVFEMRGTMTTDGPNLSHLWDTGNCACARRPPEPAGCKIEKCSSEQVIGKRSTFPYQ